MICDPTGWRGLYAIIDLDACGARPATEVASAVLAGGCAVLQLRAKRAASDDRRELARAVQLLSKSAGVPFVINDDVALAAELGAEGVHLGQTDMPLSQARALAPRACLGLSTHSPEQARAAEHVGADLIGFGPVFDTASKQNPDPVVGTALLAEVVRGARIPVVAIGGIDLINVDQVAATGVPLVACIGAICKASDPRAAAAQLHHACRQTARK